MIANNLIVTGQSRLLNKLYASAGIDVTGNSYFNGGLLIDKTYGNNSGQIVLKNGSQGNAVMIRNDGNYTYFLLSSSNSSNDYNSLRPFYIDNASGKVTFGEGFHSSKSISVGGTSTFTGKTTHNGGMSVSGTASMSELTATKGVFYDAHVTNLLRATKFDLQTISQVSGGALYISPTIILPNTNTKIIVTKNSDSTVTLDIYDPSINTTSIAGGTWGTNGRVKVSGNINGVVTGTCEGTITSINTTSYKLIIKVSGGNSASLVAGTYTASNLKDLSIALYNTGTNPVGILLNCYGTNSSAYIDIYGGSSTTPNVVIGNLTGRNLPAVNGTTPSGWSLYASNAFLSGTIVSTAGKIGGYTLSTYNLIGNNVGISSQSGYEFAFWAGSNTSSSAPFRVGHEGTLYCTQLSATGGTIGSFKITGEYLCSNPDKVGLSATNANWAFYAGYNSSTQTAPFRVTNSGTLYCTDIQATGGKIGRYTITSTYIYTGEGSNQVGIGGNQAFWAGGAASDSAPFRVSYAGALVATGADITGKITATTGSISGSLVTSGINAGNITTGTLNAARIASNSITADKIAIGDFTNYSQLDHSNYSNFGFTQVADSSASKNPWYQLKTLARDTSLTYKGTYAAYQCNGGETFRIKFQVSSTVTGVQNSDGSGTRGYLNVNVGLYSVSATGTNQWTIPTGGLSDASGTVRTVSVTATLPSDARTFGVYLQLNGYSYSGTCKVRNISVTKMMSSTLIEDGAITTGKIAASAITAAKIAASTITATQLASGAVTTDKLAASAVTAAKISVTSLSAISANLGTVTAGSINIGSGKFTVSSSGVMSCQGASINGAVTATSITANTCYSIYTGSNSTRFIYYDAPELRIGLPTNTTGDLSDLAAGFSFHGSGSTTCWGNLTASSSFTSPYITATVDMTCAGAMSVGTSLSVGSTFHIAATNAVDLSNSSAAFVLGTKNGQHLEMDDNRIQAKANATTDRAIHINPFGGNFHVNYNYGETNGGHLAFGSSGGAATIASNSNILIKGSKFSASYPGSITLRSAGYWKSSSDYLNGTVQLQDANTNTWIHLAYDATKPYFASKAIYKRTTSSGSAVHIDSSGLLLRYSSASKYKTDIEPITDGSYAYNVLKINPKTWYDKSEIESYANALTKEIEGKDPTEVYANYNHVSLERVHGLVAEDVEAAGLGKYCIYEVDAEKNTKELEGINYEKVTTLLIPIVRDLVLYTQKTAKYIHAEEITDDDRGEIATLLSRINSFREEEVIA